MKEHVLRHLHVVLERKIIHATCGGSSFRETQTRRFLNAVCIYGSFVLLQTTDNILVVFLEILP